MTTPDQYDEVVTELTNQIASLRGLRDAQVPDSVHYVAFQNEISGMTVQLTRLRGLLPRVRKLDTEISQAQHEAEDTWRYAQNLDGGIRALSLGVVVGGIVFAIGLAAGSAGTALVGAGIVLATGAGVVLTMRARGRRRQDAETADNTLRDLNTRKAALFDTPQWHADVIDSAAIEPDPPANALESAFGPLISKGGR